MSHTTISPPTVTGAAYVLFPNEFQSYMQARIFGMPIRIEPIRHGDRLHWRYYCQDCHEQLISTTSRVQEDRRKRFVLAAIKKHRLNCVLNRGSKVNSDLAERVRKDNTPSPDRKRIRFIRE